MSGIPTCDKCGGPLTPVPVLGGDVCYDCEIFHAPHGFESNWEIK